jgi:hypothetical protein
MFIFYCLASWLAQFTLSINVVADKNANNKQTVAYGKPIQLYYQSSNQQRPFNLIFG